jgi:uncharacterized protein (DUF952 family)
MTGGALAPLFHIVAADTWRTVPAGRSYAPPSLASEGFVHLSYGHQVQAVANDLYRQDDGLIVLELDAERLTGDVREEDLYDAGQLFPHLYSALPQGAVVAVHELRRGTDGHYRFPVAALVADPLAEDPAAERTGG